MLPLCKIKNIELFASALKQLTLFMSEHHLLKYRTEPLLKWLLAGDREYDKTIFGVLLLSLVYQRHTTIASGVVC